MIVLALTEPWPSGRSLLVMYTTCWPVNRLVMQSWSPYRASPQAFSVQRSRYYTTKCDFGCLQRSQCV